MKVTLIGMTNPMFEGGVDEDVIYTAMSQCYNESFDEEDAKNTPLEQKRKVMKAVLKAGHDSISEHTNFTFLIEDVSLACYDKETEVLTKDGWKLFKDVTKEDKIATLNPSTKNVEFHSYNDKIEYHYNGKLHNYKTESIDLCVTPNHNLYIKKYDVRIPSDFSLVPSENIHVKRFYMNKSFNYNAFVEDSVTINGVSYQKKTNNGKYYTKTTKDLKFNKELFVKFLAFYLSDGSTTYHKKDNYYSISISQNALSSNEDIINSKTRMEIIDTITKMGFNCSITNKEIRFTSYTLGAFLYNIGKSYEKYIPYNVYDFFDKNYAKSFIDTYVKYDGCIYKNHKFIYTTSKILCDQIQQIAFIAGYASSIYIDNRVGKTHNIGNQVVTHNHIEYRLSLVENRNNNDVIIKMNKHFSEENYDDNVYCLEVPNHILFVRRNGLACWCGNCTHQLVRHRLASYSQRSSRYTNLEGGEWFVVPHSIAKNEKALAKFIETMRATEECYRYLTNECNIPFEDARFTLPAGKKTNIVVTMNCRSLKNFFAHRLCTRAQWEIRELAQEMAKICKEKLPVVFDECAFGEAKCVQNGYCVEPKKQWCHKRPHISELKGQLYERSMGRHPHYV